MRNAFFSLKSQRPFSPRSEGKEKRLFEQKLAKAAKKQGGWPQTGTKAAKGKFLCFLRIFVAKCFSYCFTGPPYPPPRPGPVPVSEFSTAPACVRLWPCLHNILNYSQMNYVTKKLKVNRFVIAIQRGRQFNIAAKSAKAGKGAFILLRFPLSLPVRRTIHPLAFLAIKSAHGHSMAEDPQFRQLPGRGF